MDVRYGPVLRVFLGIVNQAETRIVVEDGQCRARTYDLSGVNRMLFQLS